MIEQFMKQDLNDNPFNNPLINQDFSAAAAEGQAALESPKLKHKKTQGDKEKPMIDEQINHSMLVRQIEEQLRMMLIHFNIGIII